MSLQDRTLVVKNFDPERTTHRILKELCIQSGPVVNVVLRPDHAFVEFEDIESVGYSKALLDGVKLFGRKLVLEPKTRAEQHFKYTRILHDYIKYDKQQQALQLQAQQQMMSQYLPQQQQPQFHHQHQQQYQQPSLQTLPMPLHGSHPSLSTFTTMPQATLPSVTNMTTNADPSLFNFTPYSRTQSFNQSLNVPFPTGPMPPPPQSSHGLHRSRSFNHQRPHYSRNSGNNSNHNQNRGRHRTSWGGRDDWSKRR